MSLSLSAGVLGVGFLLLGLALFSAYCAGRWILAQAGALRRDGGLIALGAAGVGLLVLGSRLWIAQGRVSWAPYLDQLFAEFTGLLLPLSHGTLRAGDLFAANNEHRVVLTRTVSLALVWVDGEWDNRAEVMVTFLLESATVAWICALCWTFLGWVRGTYVGAAALLPMLVACDWENLVSGFQNQFGFLVLGSVVAASLISGPAPGRRAAWGVLSLSALLVGSMVSGLLTAAAVAASVLAMAYSRRAGWRPCAAFCAALLAIAAAGWLTRAIIPPQPGMRADGVGSFAAAFLAYASWPLWPGALGFLCLWLPWTALAGRILLRRETPRLAPFALALGLWVLLQAAALAWGRASLSGLVGSRYTEVLGLGFVANAAAVVLLEARRGASGAGRGAYWVLALGWFAGVGGSEVWRSQAVYRPYFLQFRQQTLEHEERLGTFMRTGDARVITDVGFPRIPGSAAEILSLLGDGRVQRLLPAPLRRELVRERDPARLGQMQSGPVSFAAIRLLNRGAWLVAAGAALLAGALVTALRRGRPGPCPP